MSIDHQAHTLRKHLGEWCGGTEPPTIVTINKDEGEVYVDVFETGSNLHVGEILDPVSTEQFLTPTDGVIGPVEVGGYALRALQAGTR